MGTLTAGAAVLDVNVLDSTQLTNPTANVAHYPIGGGLPDITIRDSSGLSGSLEVLCPDAATAQAVYAAHLDGQVIHLDDAPLNFTYLCVDGGPEIPHLRDGHWIVRVTGVQEVAP
jgi:hypothetical protein